MREVGPRVFAYVQATGETGISNAGLIVGADGATAVDALMVPSMTRRLVARPSVMLVDEPTEGLAPIIVQSLTEILARINRRGTTLLLVEQTLEVAMALSHRLYVMDQGRIQFEGTPDALRRDPTIQQRFLEV